MLKIFALNKINIKISLNNLLKEIVYKNIIPQIIVKTRSNSFTILEAWSNLFGEQISTDYHKNKSKYISDIYKILTHSPSESVLDKQGLCLITSKRHREYLLKTQKSHTLSNGQELVLLNIDKICFPTVRANNKSLLILKKDEYLDLINTVLPNK